MYYWVIRIFISFISGITYKIYIKNRLGKMQTENFGLFLNKKLKKFSPKDPHCEEFFSQKKRVLFELSF